MEKVRIVYTDQPGRCMPEHKGKVFAVIGPFEDHLDKDDLQAELETVLRSYNLKATFSK